MSRFSATRFLGAVLVTSCGVVGAGSPPDVQAPARAEAEVLWQFDTGG